MSYGIQTKIAKAATVSVSFVNLILSGKKRPSWDVAKRLEAATGISAVLWIDGKVDREYLNEHYNPGATSTHHRKTSERGGQRRASERREQERREDERRNHGRRITNGSGQEKQTEYGELC
jgi:transcriptional regulator with XRE-family HTH domain